METMALRVIVLFVLLGCAQCKQSNLSCKEIRAFVDGHNNRRAQLADGSIHGQPAATDMKIMVWDNELAAKAAKWASRKRFQHNPDRTVGSGRFKTGENIYMYWTTASNYNFDVDTALKSWFDEHKYYRYGPLTKADFRRPSNVEIGHYTQMAWANTVYVGCGLSRWTGNNGMHNYFVVCNYGPAGNFIGQTPYRSGQPRGLTCGIRDCSRKYGNSC